MTDKNTDKNYLAITDAGVADAKRFHRYTDCSTVRNRTANDFEEVSDREIRLMGLKVCTVCERRATGGPIIDALKDIVAGIAVAVPDGTDEEHAWHILEALKERGMYIASRKVKSALEKSVDKALKSDGD